MTKPWTYTTIAELPLWIRAAMLFIVMSLPGAGALAIGYAVSGTQGVATAAVAVGVCFASGLIALVVTHLFTQAGQFLWGVLAGAGIRSVLPLVALALVHLLVPLLENAGFVYYLVFFYLLVLGVETKLSLPVEQLRQPAKPVPSSRASNESSSDESSGDEPSGHESAGDEEHGSSRARETTQG